MRVEHGIMPNEPKTRADKSKQAARELGSDEDKARWGERLRKVAVSNPAPEKAE